MTPPNLTTLRSRLLPLLLAACAATLHAQNTPPGTTAPPVTDSAAQASPSTPPPAAPVADAAAEASPDPAPPHGVSVPTNVDLSVHVLQATDSAHAKNGDMLRATLATPMRGPGGKTIPAGTKVSLTIVTVTPAGKIQSRGELSLQVVSIAGASTQSDILTLHGQPGHKDLPDSQPDKGTEASIAANSTLHFKIPPPPKQ